MWVETIPDSLTMKFTRKLKRGVDKDLLPLMKSKNVVKLIDSLRERQAWIYDMNKFKRQFVHPLTGEEVRGFVMMDSLMVDYYCDLMQIYPASRKFMLRGVATNFDEVLEHCRAVSNATEQGLVKKLVGQQWIVRVQKSRDWELFESLYHVGEWGQRLRVDQENNPYTVRAVKRQKLSGASPWNHYDHYEQWNFGKRKGKIRKRICPTSHWRGDGSLSDWEQLVESYLDYRKTYGSFFFF